MGRVSIEERARMLAGASHWRTNESPECGIEALVLSDGPHGLRKQEGREDHLGIAESRPATCFPSASALACSFDPALVEEIGAALGEEAIEQGVDVVLGPGVNIKRHPLCGRNFEYLSEDPALSGSLGAAMVRGIQRMGVAACLKHFAGNSQEHARMVEDSVIDERALRELYLAPFEQVVREAAPCSVMTAYNRLNGEYCTQNRWLLHDVLRGEWGFDGVVVSDWGAMSSSVDSVRAGLDLCMPGPRPDHATSIAGAVRAGELSEDVLDARVEALSRLSKRVRGRAGQDSRIAAARESTGAQGAACASDACGSTGPSCRSSHDREAFYRGHADLARRAASQSAVLLKNDGVLPLDTSRKVAVIGAFARLPRYQGSGSSRINPKFLDNIWYRMEQRGFSASYADGYDPFMGDASESQLVEAERLAAASDVAVVVAGLPARYESEGFDRKLMVMPKGHVELIERVCAANPRMVVVLQGGAPMEMPWRDAPAAILLMYLSGCQGGGAAVDILSGDVNPSGKLAETWPERLEDTALGSTYPDMDREVHYRESLFVGYRYYDAVDVEPAYPFGFGLSYTRFDYGEARMEDGKVHATVRNGGTCAGAEVVQVYIEPDPGVVPPPCPVRWLAAFTKMHLAPGEECSVSLDVPAAAIRVWDVEHHAWRIYPGTYTLKIAASSRDVRHEIRVKIDQEGSITMGEKQPTPVERMQPGEEEAFRHATVPEIYARPHRGCFREPEADRAFTALYGRPLPERPPLMPFTMDSTVQDMGASWFGRRMFGIIDWVMAEPASKMDHVQRTMMKEMAADMPLRSMTMSGVPLSAVEGFVSMLNGHYLTGFIRVVKGLLSMVKAG